MDTCVICGRELLSSHLTPYSREHLIQHRQEEKIKKWQETGDTGYTVDTTIRGPIRQFILEQQNHQCAICGIDDMWNGKRLVFVQDHIDGDASHSSVDNLRLVCPNCDSQLDTYKSKNKNSARNLRKKFNRLNTVDNQ